MDFLNFSPEQFKVFILILMRVSVVLFLFPIFDSTMLPNLVKVGLALAFSLMLFPVIPIDYHLFPTGTVGVAVLLVSELMVGLILGLSVRFFLAAVQLAGQMVGFQMGFAIINVVDPQTGGQVSIIDQIGSMMVVLVFLLLDGHHILLMALVESFQHVGLGLIVLNRALLAQDFSLSADMFVLAVKIGSPAIAALLFTSAAFGLAARFVPQMNILMAAFPVKIVVGLVFFGISLQIMAISTRSFVNGLGSMLNTLLILIGGG